MGEQRAHREAHWTVAVGRTIRCSCTGGTGDRDDGCHCVDSRHGDSSDFLCRGRRHGLDRADIRRRCSVSFQSSMEFEFGLAAIRSQRKRLESNRCRRQLRCGFSWLAFPTWRIGLVDARNATKSLMKLRMLRDRFAPRVIIVICAHRRLRVASLPFA